MSTIKYGKRIITETYYDGTVASSKEELEFDKFTDKQMMLKDIIETLGTINRGETKRLVIEICVDSKNRYRLTSRWVV